MLVIKYFFWIISLIIIIFGSSLYIDRSACGGSSFSLQEIVLFGGFCLFGLIYLLDFTFTMTRVIVRLN